MKLGLVRDEQANLPATIFEVMGQVKTSTSDVSFENLPSPGMGEDIKDRAGTQELHRPLFENVEVAPYKFTFPSPLPSVPVS